MVKNEKHLKLSTHQVSNMNPITSIYIPCIDNRFNAEFIANVFNLNGIAKVSKVYIEPYKYIINNDLNGYNRAYISIKSWHETEAAYNFIGRLRNPNKETRLVYSDDNWWPVKINNNINKLASNKRVLTVFEEKQANFCDDDLNTTTDELDEFVQIDAEKTKLLRNIISKFKDSLNEEAETHLYRSKALHKREHLLQDMDETAEAFNGYLCEMNNDRELWYSEQYIYDALCM